MSLVSEKIRVAPFQLSISGSPKSAIPRHDARDKSFPATVKVLHGKYFLRITKVLPIPREVIGFYDGYKNLKALWAMPLTWQAASTHTFLARFSSFLRPL